MKYGIALGGGGVRGAFQMGVWKALRKMNIEIGAAVGTSIGAINAALMVQDEYAKAMKMWRKITIEDIIALPKGMEGEKNIFKAKNLGELVKHIYEKEGLDMSPLENILRGIIDEEKIRKSPADFGIAALSLTNRKGIYKRKEEIPEGQLIDYIMASASILSKRQIEDETFYDGGMFDNMPVHMLGGMKDIITVDVQGIGLTRSFSSEGRNIISIRSSSPQTGIMDFDRAGISRSIDEGYITCMRAFGRVMGSIYPISTKSYLDARKKYSEQLISGVEKAARVLDVDTLEIYTFDGLAEIVKDRFLKLSGVSSESVEQSGEKQKKESDNALLIRLVKNIWDGKTDFVADKLPVISDIYDGASAIVYFIPTRQSS